MKGYPLILLAALGLSARAAGPVPASVAPKPTLVILGTGDLAPVKKQAGLLRAGKSTLDQHRVEILGEQRPGGVLHKRFGHGRGFLLVLVGSDGEEKLRSLQPLPVDRLAKALEASEKKSAVPESDTAPVKSENP